VNNLHAYRVRFLDHEGALMKDLSVLAESLAVATDRAGTKALEIGASNFFITAKADEKSPS